MENEILTDILIKSISQKLAVKLKLDDHSESDDDPYLIMNPHCILFAKGDYYIRGFVTRSMIRFIGCTELKFSKIVAIEQLQLKLSS